MKKRIFSFALMVTLCCGLLATIPLTASAGNGDFTSPSDNVIAVGNEAASFVIKNDGGLWGWGANAWGQIGNGTKQSITTPIKIMDEAVSVVAGYDNTFAVKTDGGLWAWGYNPYGELGDGTTEDKLLPVKILDNVKSVCTGTSHTMAIRTDGSLWAWGRNDYGQLGDGTLVDKSKPVKIFDNVKTCSVEYDFTVAIQSDGSLWAWGAEKYGTPTDTSVELKGPMITGTISVAVKPYKIMDGVKDVRLTQDSTFVLKSDDSLWAWGYNNSGQLGDGKTETRMLQNAVKIMDSVSELSVDAGSSSDTIFAVRTDGSLWGWGYNLLGQLGDGTTQNKSTPLKIMEDTVGIWTTHGTTMAMKSDGSLWTWGLNTYGNLGNGIMGTEQTTPSQIMGDVICVAMYDQGGRAIKKDGSIWGWGANYDGQLGNGTIAEGQPVPIKISDGAKLTTPMVTPIVSAQTSKTVNPTPSKVFVNGTEKSFEAYNIDGSNYFKLRDVAFVLNGTSKPFEVGYDNSTSAITMTSGQQYTPTGGEMTAGDGQAKPAKPTASKIYLDGNELSFTVYNIGGNNFFKLVDLMSALNIGVTYNQTNGNISIDTNVDHIGVVTVQ